MARKVRARFIPRNELAAAIAAALGSFAPTAQAQLAADALPTGGSVASGSATIATTVAGQMQINQASDKAILNWQSFSIGSAAWVNFSQPSASAIALNRVTGNNPSQIFGHLSANGQVFLSNPSGVLFAPGASVDVGALFATTLSITDSDFLNGNYNFFNPGGAGSVVNQASITAGSYAALAGPQVSNEGVIVAQSGVVALAAGERVSLDMAGDGLISVSVDQAALNASALNSGSIQADGGRVVLTTGTANALLDTVVNNSGVIRANSLVERNGEIVLDAGSGDVQAGALESAGGHVTLAGRDITVTDSVSAQNIDVAAAGRLTVDASGSRDAVLSSSGGQSVSAERLVIRAQDGRNARLMNFGGDQAVTVGAGGIELSATAGTEGRAQIRNQPGTGAQSVRTTGNLEVTAGGSPAGGAWTSGVFQLGSGPQAVQAANITLQAATTGSTGAAIISSNGDQAIEVTGALNLFAGAEGFGNRAGISSAGNQTITGGADITLRGGDSGTGTSPDLTSNGAFLSASTGAQTIDAGNITLQAGAGGSDTFAAITGASQVIHAAGDVVLRGGSAAPGTGNGARIGGPGGASNGPTSLHLIAHDVTITGGSTTGAALGSGVGGGPRNDITVEATGDITLTSDADGGVRIGYGPSDPAGGSLNVHADGSITLSATGRGSVIRSLDDVTLSAGGAINEWGKSNVIGSSLTTSSGGDTFLGSFNQAGTYAGTSGGSLLLNNFGFLSLGNINAGGTLSLFNNGALSVTASGAQDTIVSSNFGQTISASSISVEGRDGRRAILINANGDQQISATAGSIDLLGVNGQGLAKIVNGLPGIVSFGNQTVSASGDLNVVGGAALGGSGGRFSNSGISQNNGGTQTIAAANIELQGSHFVDNGGALISNQNGGGNQVIETSGDIRITAGSFGTGNRAGIFTNGEQSVSTGGDIVVTGGAGGGGDALSGTSNSATIEKRGSGQQTVSARNIVVTAGSDGVDTSATLTGTTQVIAASGNVEINGSSGNTGGFNGARIGGPGSGSSDLALSAANVLLTGGAGSGAAIGGNATSSAPQTLSITTTGDFVMSALNGRGVRMGTVPGVAAPGSIRISAGGDIALNAPTAIASISSGGSVELHADGAITETGNALVAANTLTSSSLGETRLGGPNRVFNFSGTSGGDFTLNNVTDLSIGGIESAGAMTLNNAGTLMLLGDGASDALITSNGGQSISADRLVVDALNDRLARILNQGGDQTVTVGAGGIDLTAVDGHGAAQIVNRPGALTDGTQSVSTSGLLNVLGGSTSDGRGTNSGVIQVQSGKQTVTAGSIELRAAVAGVVRGGALIVNSDGGPDSDQEINVADGFIRLTAGGVGFINLASIFSSGNQTINGNADITVTGGSSGTGTNSIGNNNAANIATNTPGKTQTIHAHDLTVQAGPAGSDTNAAITSDTQTIIATGDVYVIGGGNTGSANGARIGASGRTRTGTNLTLSAHNVTVTGGETVSGASIGNSNAAGTLPSNISITATGDVTLNSGAGNGARIGAPNGADGGGTVVVDATGSIALNGGAHAATIRGGEVTLHGASIIENGNAPISAQSLTVNVDGAAQLGGPNEVASFSGTSGGDLIFTNNGDLAVTGIAAGGILTLGNTGTLTLAASGGNDALITSIGGQTIDAAALVLHAQDGGLARIVNNGGDQAITAGGGIDLVSVDGQGAAQIVNARDVVIDGTQTVTADGLLNVLGGVTSGDLRGTNSGVFQSQTGRQTVTAGSIELRAADAPVTLGGAFITSFDGGPNSDQEINVAAGTIRITGGGTGFSNRALFSAGGNQTINGNADIFITGGSSGFGTNASGQANSASISANTAGKTQTIHAHDIVVQAGSGGVDTFAAITSNNQVIIATGDVRITGGANSGSSNGARIGAPGNTTTGTSLTLTAHDVTLTGGESISGAAIGSSGNSSNVDNFIHITATGDVVLNSGLGNGARIGSPNGDSGGGLVDINALGSIVLDGGAHAATIRTAGHVALHGGSISETPNGQILAHSLWANADGIINLGGGNEVSFFGANSGGDMLFKNSGALSLIGIGAGGTLGLFNAGTLTVNAQGGADAVLFSNGGQTISAEGLVLHAQDGRRAALHNNNGGDQTVTVGAGGIVLDAGAGNGRAQIFNNFGTGTQTVTTGGALTVQAGGTLSGVTINSGVFQNASGKQTVGAASLTLQGATSGSGGGAFISNSSNGGGEQEVQVSGTLNVLAGGDGSGNRAGIVSSGSQTIVGGADITVVGGSSGSGTSTGGTSNGALIVANGPQTIDAHDITLQAGSGGEDTFATINAVSQVIRASGDVTLRGGSASGSANGARIGGPGGATSRSTDLQLYAHNVTLTDGPTSGVALGSQVGGGQRNDITVEASGNVTLASNSPLGGVRIGYGPGEVAGGHIAVHADGDISLSAPGRGAVIRSTEDVALSAGGSISEAGNAFVAAGSLTTGSGGSTTLAGANQLASFRATSGGDVLLNNTGVLEVTGLTAAGNAALDNVGNVTISGPWTAGGTTSITVHSDLFLQSTLQSRDVELTATSGLIQQAADASIQAESLTTASVGDTTLAGDNTVSSFSATSDTGGVTLNNSGPLTVTHLEASGEVQLENDGPVTLETPVDTTGRLVIASQGDLSLTESVTAGDLVVRSETGRITVGSEHATEAVVLYGSRSLAMEAPGDILVRGSDCTVGAGTYVLTDGLLSVHGASFSLVGGAAALAPAVAAGSAVDVRTTGDLTLTGGSGWLSPALLLGGRNISLAVGGVLRLDGGRGEESFARIQAATRDGEIHLTFGNESGEYVVDGREGRIKHGQDGFYIGLKPAKEGYTFFVDYE